MIHSTKIKICDILFKDSFWSLVWIWILAQSTPFFFLEPLIFFIFVDLVLKIWMLFVEILHLPTKLTYILDRTLQYHWTSKEGNSRQPGHQQPDFINWDIEKRLAYFQYFCQNLIVWYNFHKEDILHHFYQIITLN